MHMTWGELFNLFQHPQFSHLSNDENSCTSLCGTYVMRIQWNHLFSIYSTIFYWAFYDRNSFKHWSKRSEQNRQKYLLSWSLDCGEMMYIKKVAWCLVVISCVSFGRSLRFTESQFTKNGAKITHTSYDCFEDPVRSGRWSLAVTVSKYNSKLSAKYHVSGSWRSELGTVPAVGKFKVVGSFPPETKWSMKAEGSSRATQEANL